MSPFCREAALLARIAEGPPLEDGGRQALELDRRAAVATAYRVTKAEAWLATLALQHLSMVQA